MRSVLALLLAVPALAAPVPKELRAPKTDLEALQGEWVVVESSTYGKPTPQSHGIRYTVTGNAVRVTRTDGGGDGTITLDEKAKTYSWKMPWGTWAGRYRLDGDRLVMSAVGGDKPPADLQPGPAVEYDILSRPK